MWNLLLRCLCRPVPGHRPAALAAMPAPPQADDRPLGCGWFDSSHELAQGTLVTELDDAATPLWRWAALAQA